MPKILHPANTFPKAGRHNTSNCKHHNASPLWTQQTFHSGCETAKDVHERDYLRAQATLSRTHGLVTCALETPDERWGEYTEPTSTCREEVGMRELLEGQQTSRAIMAVRNKQMELVVCADRTKQAEICTAATTGLGPVEACGTCGSHTKKSRGRRCRNRQCVATDRDAVVCWLQCRLRHRRMGMAGKCIGQQMPHPGHHTTHSTRNQAKTKTMDDGRSKKCIHGRRDNVKPGNNGVG